MCFQPWEIHFLVLGPAAAGNKSECIGLCRHEAVDIWQFSRIGANFGHTVEAGVACYGYVFDAYAFEQQARALVLHIQTLEFAEHPAEHCASGVAEENLPGTKNSRYYVCVDAAAFEFAEIITPEFVLYKHSHSRFRYVEKRLYGRR